MKNYNELSDEQLTGLIKEEKDLEAFDILKERYKGRIYSLVGKYFRTFCNIGQASKVEAVETAEAALLNAAIKYDCEKGTKFSTYAWACIDGEIKNYIKNNKSLVLKPAMQRRLNMVINMVVESKKSGLFPKGKEISNIIRDNHEQLINLLSSKYPQENWDKYIDEISSISTLSEISMDETIGESNGTKHNIVDKDIKKEFILSPKQLIEDEGPSGRLLAKEKYDMFKKTYLFWMNKMILLFCGKKRDLIYHCLKNYYINLKDASDIINSLNSMGYSGDKYLRQNRSRFEKSVERGNKGLLDMMIKSLNEHFDANFEYLTKAGSIRDDFGEFCKDVRNLILQGEEP